MKNIISLFLIFLAYTLPNTTFAQTFGIKLGANMSTMMGKDDFETYDDNWKLLPGFHVGPTAEFPINESFSFETGLILMGRGIKVDLHTEDFLNGKIDVEGNLRLLYLDIPLTAKTSFPMGNNRLFALLGPYVGIGLTGKGKGDSTIGGVKESYEEDISWGSDADEDDYKRLDFGLNGGLGLLINAVEVGLFYSWGLANNTPDTSDGHVRRNRVFGLSAGYKFGGGDAASQ